MDISCVPADPCVVRLQGRFDANECEEFGSYIDRLKADGSKNLILDLSAVDFIDSMALATLVSLSKWATANGHSFEVQDPSDPVRVILEITAIDRALTIVTSPVGP